MKNGRDSSILVGFAVLVALASTGCSGGKKPEYLPPQTLTPEALQPTPPESIVPGVSGAEEETDTEEDFPEETSATDLIVIEDEKPVTPTERTLYAAAQEERARRQTAGPSKVSITNKNLDEYAASGNLTFSGESGEDSSTEPVPTDRPKLAAELLADEAYWRTRVRDARLAWREAVDLVAELEEAAAALRMRFYAEDDPFYRDGEIKPAWDRTLDRLAEARTEAVAMEDEVDEILEEGRRAGALPGWLREGLELEPESKVEVKETEVEHQSIEPDVVGEDGGGL